MNNRRTVVGLTLAVTGVVTATALAASTDFVATPSSPIAVADRPFAIAAADFDGDGDRDLATASGPADGVTPNGITILRNNGAAAFSEPASSPELVPQPVEIAVADFDGDTDQDLASVNYLDNRVTVLLNSGVGNFGEPPSSPEVVERGYATAVAAIDVDGDLDQDLAVTTRGVHGVWILINDGTGDFTPSAFGIEHTGRVPYRIAVADLDGDTDLDLAVVNERRGFSVTLLRNNGAGNFQSSFVSTGRCPDGHVLPDVDGDGDRDLVVPASCDGEVGVYLNDGNMGFAEAPTSPEPLAGGRRRDIRPDDVVAPDLDGDGDRDLAVVNRGIDAVGILENTGSGDFVEPATSPEAVGDAPQNLVAANFDRDGDPDLATLNFDSDDVTILRNR